ncbi:MAG TPA: ribosomal RNA small subunit methyltransferase A, partial [Candidatus Methylomirabilis sp.]
LVRLDLLDAPGVPTANPAQLFAVVRAAFGTRRKMLRNALMRAGWPTQAVEAALQTAGVEGRRRGETLTLEEFARVSKALPVREVTADGDAKSGSDED